MKSVVLLVGPKGSGKTTIGRAIAARAGIKFLDVEKTLIEYVRRHPESGSDLPNHGFDIEFAEIESALGFTDAIILEATGSSEYLPRHLSKIRSKFNLLPIKIECAFELCSHRLASRNSKNNFEVSEDMIKNIYDKTSAFHLDWLCRIDSASELDPDDVCQTILSRLKAESPRIRDQHDRV